MDKLKLKDWQPSERPRERLMEKGPAALSDAELVAILLRTGNREDTALDLSRRVLWYQGGVLRHLARTPWKELAQIKGMGPVKALTLAAAFELGLRLNRPAPALCEIKNARDIVHHMAPMLKDLPYEECWALYLNAGRRIIAKEKISSGGITSTVVDVRRVLHAALRYLACELILVHNHPSGNPTPGDQDRKLTHQLRKAAELVSVNLIDHVVIGGGAYYSFMESGTL